ncbi:MAG TPA: TRAP transporter large permease [Bacteroidales bacterium]|nr:TRAP transporter large permease [Bacteroidales bacterium]
MIWILVGSLFFCMLLSIPIALALASSCALVFMITYGGTQMMHLLAQAMITTSDSFPLMAIPFFMLVGTLMSRSGLAKEIIGVGDAFTGEIAGGLGASTVVACMIFAAISGSGPAVVAALGVILVPAMEERKYDTAYAGSLVAAGATIGPVIPPSIPMIVYGVVGGTSVVAMFAGGILPGILMGTCLVTVNYFVSKKRGYLGKKRGGGFSWICKVCWQAKWALALPILILGGIYGGVFTPTEAAVIGSVYALVVGTFIYKQLTIKKISAAMVEAALLSSLSMFVLGGASTFGRLLTMERIPQQLAEAMLSLTQSPVLIMALIIGFLFISGMFIDTISNIVLFTPLFLPIVEKVGYHPVFFGVIMTIILCIGMVTPPVGVNLYVAQGVCRAPFANMIREVLPLILALMAGVVLILIFPGIVMFIPKVLGLVH